MDSSLSKADIEELLLEMGSFSKMMRGRTKEKKPKFPYKCKNGSSCPFLACGSCWFVHDDDALPIVSQHNVKVSNMPMKFTQPQESLQDKLRVIDDFEKKFVDLSKSIDHRLAAFELKLDAMADEIFKNEADVQEMQEEKAVISKPEELRQNIDERIDEKLEIFLKESVKCAFEAAFASFSQTVGEKVVVIERELEKLSKGIG